ncbi:hypothetical protein [Pseudomonas sp. BGI-2]|uniref:hypothetical protein n=1 Tax=Pseudomonas sp. BGI-2 TaxID=2528211 RepID=UPI0010338A31|nr:hypothetical protein [Pseudomonas sp. BGI-2]TBN34134.1 hypothetical protein EYC95_27515 [Pseudomonas sp. BGI-2]
MTAQEKTMPAPVLKEANNDVLYVGKLTGPAHGEVTPHGDMTVGDKVEFTVQTSTGNHWSGTKRVEPVPLVMVFAIPKETFEKGLVPDATAKLRYRVTSASGNQADSIDLVVQLKP